MSKSKSKGAKKAAKKKESDKAAKAVKAVKASKASKASKGSGKGASKSKASKRGSSKAEPLASSPAALAAPNVYDVPVDVEPVEKKLRPDEPITSVLRVRRGFVLADFDPESTPGFDEGRKEGEEALSAFAPEMGAWQERLFAETGLVDVEAGELSPGQRGQGRHRPARDEQLRPGRHQGHRVQGAHRGGAPARLLVARP